VLFRQLFEPVTSSFTYLLADEGTREAVLVDTVLEELETYVALVAELGLTLRWTLETHVHADHVTAADALRRRLGSRSALHHRSSAMCADRLLSDGDVIEAGGLRIQVIETPGHTDSCVAFLAGDRVLTGDALMIGGCGRTDFQQGDAGRLYDSVHGRLFTLPPETLVYPAHDYKGNRVSTIGREIATNPRLGGGKTRDEFVEIMRNLSLAYPKQMDRAVPANQRCGREPAQVADRV
jgi:sulfur dioxygenase